MEAKTLVRIFDDQTHALAAVRDLERAGFTENEVSLMANSSGAQRPFSVKADAIDEAKTTGGTGVGASFGTLLGGGAGLLAGIGALAIPGIGPIVAAGWLVATLAGAGTGAVAGGLLGSLANSGVDEREAHVYTESLRRGSTLVSVRGTETRLAQAASILSNHRSVDVAARDAGYRADGWSGFRAEEGSAMPSPDGTPGNPRGTVVTRSFDEAVGANISGAHPENADSRGTRGPISPAVRAPNHTVGVSPSQVGSGQITPRADDDGRIVPRQPDGAPGNPPGTEASRGVDEVLGTNVSGAHPENDRPRRI